MNSLKRWRRLAAAIAASVTAMVAPKCGLCLLVYAGLVVGPGVELCGASPSGVPVAWKALGVASVVIGMGIGAVFLRLRPGR